MTQKWQCSFCEKTFDKLQQLGGHQTCHREEISALRKKHLEMMKSGRETNRNSLGFKIVLLRPNPAFWQMYRKYGIEPKVIDFFPLEANKVGVPKLNVEYCEVTSTEVDLMFKL